MEKAKLFRSPLQEREAKLVAGVSRKDVGMQSKLYDYCKRYFWTNYRGLFFISEIHTFSGTIAPLNTKLSAAW